MVRSLKYEQVWCVSLPEGRHKLLRAWFSMLLSFFISTGNVSDAEGSVRVGRRWKMKNREQSMQNGFKDRHIKWVKNNITVCISFHQIRLQEQATPHCSGLQQQSHVTWWLWVSHTSESLFYVYSPSQEVLKNLCLDLTLRRKE